MSVRTIANAEKYGVTPHRSTQRSLADALSVAVLELFPNDSNPAGNRAAALEVRDASALLTN